VKSAQDRQRHFARAGRQRSELDVFRGARSMTKFATLTVALSRGRCRLQALDVDLPRMQGGQLLRPLSLLSLTGP